MIDPKEFIITRKRKKYKFALFANSPISFEAAEWQHAAPFAPDVLEIGAGNGLFSVANAQENLQQNFVAADVKADRLQHGARKAELLKLQNIAFVRARADQLLDYFQPVSLSAIWVTFPDPFPRDRSAKHRLTHRRFLEIYQKLLKNNGAVYFKTDNHALFDWSIQHLIENGWRIDQLSYDLHDSQLPAGYKHLTTYEKRFLTEGLTTCFLRAQPPLVPATSHQ